MGGERESLQNTSSWKIVNTALLSFRPARHLNPFVLSPYPPCSLKLPHFLLCSSFTSLSSFVLLWQDRIYNMQVLPSCMLSFTWCPIPKEDMLFHLTDASCPSWCALQSRGSKFKCPQEVEKQPEWGKVGRDHGELEWCPTNGDGCYQAPVDSYHGENGIPMLPDLLIFQKIWKSRFLGEIHPLLNVGN